MAVRSNFVCTQKTPEIAARARNAKSNEELALACQELNIADKIFLGKIDLWLAKNALSAIFNTLKKYPALRWYMHYFGTLNGFTQNKNDLFVDVNGYNSPRFEHAINQFTDSLVINCRNSFMHDGLAIAFFTGTDRVFLSGIIINGKSLNLQSIVENLQYGERTGFSPKGCNSVKSVIDHEIGHLFDYMLNVSDSIEFRRLMTKYDASYLYHNLSQYCVMNNTVAYKEVVAEAYSEYCNNPNPREVAKAVGNLTVQKYNDKFGKYFR